MNSVNAEPESPGHRAASPTSGAGPDVVGLVFDGERLQCAECGGWYRHLATHVFLAHGLLAQDYRAEHGLAASVPLVVAEISDALRASATARGTEHLDQWRRPGPERDELVDKLRETKREQADEYWARRLAEVGWRSWFDATGWAQEAGAGWAGIGERLGISWQSARTAALRAGATLQHRSWRFFELAEAYVHEHGNLDYADGELGRYLANARAYARRTTGSPSEIGAALDALDPNWRLTAAERITRSLAAGEVFEHPTARRHRKLWEQRLATVGWVSWSDAVFWAARTGGGPAQIAERLDTDAMQVSRALRLHWQQALDAGTDPHSPVAAAGYILEHAPGCGGALTSDDHTTDSPAVIRTSVEEERIQCMVCGLWLGTLGQHLPLHQLTGTDYKTRFRLSPQARLSGYRPRRTAPPAHSPEYWDPILAAHQFPDLKAAADWAIDAGMTVPELARHLGVPYTRLNRALKAAGLRFPTVGDRMIIQAKQHVAAGGNLSEAPTPEMRAWLDTVRASLRAGRTPVFAAQLDHIDPHWHQSAHHRATTTGTPYIHKGTRGAQARYQAGLARAGWDSFEHAAAWANTHNAPVAAIAIATGLPTARVAAHLKRLGYQLPTPPKSGHAFHTRLRAIADHLRHHKTFDGLDQVSLHWLARRHRLETTSAPLPDPWINNLLDHLHPTWRTEHPDTTPAPAPAESAATRTRAGSRPITRKQQPRTAAAAAKPEPHDHASEPAVDKPTAPYTIDQHWQDRLTATGWTTWNNATTWAAHRHAGISAIANRLGVPQVDILEQLQHWWTAHPETLHHTSEEPRQPLPGHGTPTPCPACRLYFTDTASHYKAAHPHL